VGDLASIFKAYDIRGIVPDQLDEAAAQAIGAAFAKVTDAGTILTVHDMRATSGPLAAAFGRGAAAQGANVLAAGLGSTDMLYYGSGDLGIPGAMVTASHNPPQYNGIKLCRAGAKPVGVETGLKDIKDLAERALPVPWICYPATPSTSGSSSTSPRSGRSPWPWTPATGWPGTPCRRSSRGCRSR
jgi:phosphomannomutase